MTPLAVIVQEKARMNSCVESVLTSAVEEAKSRLSFIDKSLAWILLHLFNKNYYPKYHIIDASKINNSNIDHIRDYDVVGIVGLECSESMALRMAVKKLEERKILFVEFYTYSEAILRDSENRLAHIKRRLFHLNDNLPGHFSDHDDKFNIYVQSAKRMSEKLSEYMKAV